MDKRLIYRFAAAFVAMLLLAFPVSGQTPEPSKVPAVPAAPAVPVEPVPAERDSTARLVLSDRPIAADSLERIDPVDTDLVALRRSAEGEEVVLEVAGFGITALLVVGREDPGSQCADQAAALQSGSLLQVGVGLQHPFESRLRCLSGGYGLVL